MEEDFVHIQAHLQNVQSALGHSFTDSDCLLRALTHSSYFNETLANGVLDPTKVPLGDNERFEFLGDAVIGLVVAKKLMELFPDANEGKLSRWRSSLVSRKTLADIAADLGMGNWVLLGRGERRTGGGEKRSILAGVFEAVIGALYLDAGLEPATEFLLRVYHPTFLALVADGELAISHFDQKTSLQERTQALYKSIPTYRLVGSWGLEHEKNFRVEIEVDGKVIAHGHGKSKKEAEQNAATLALEVLGF